MKTLISMVVLFMFVGVAMGEPVKMVIKEKNSFEIKTGDYTLCYNRPKVTGSENQIIILSTDSSKSIGNTVLNGSQLKPLHETLSKSITYVDTDKDITVSIITKVAWGTIESQLIAYKKYPGLIRFSGHVLASQFTTLQDNPLEFLFVGGAHQVKRYFTQIGPAAGMVYFYDRDMDLTALYFQDYSSLNDLYRLTGVENPYNSGAEGGWTEGAAKMTLYRQPEQYSVYFTNAPAPVPVEKTFLKEAVTDIAGEFGYERPKLLKIPSGKKYCLNDSYLYLTPGMENKSAKTCKRFVEMLGVIYQHIQKPSMETVDWTGEIVPKLVKNLNEPHNWLKPNNGMDYLAAYVKDHRNGYGELITQLEILVPLTEYVKKHPDQKETVQLMDKLNKTIPTFWDDSSKTFNDGIPPVANYQSGWYYFFPGAQMSDLARLGNKDAIRMFQGTREYYLKVGKKFNYQFACFDLKSEVESHVYEYDVTGLYLNIMMDYYELSGGKDKECLVAAMKCADVIAGHEFQYAYELNYTASGSVGLYRLYQATHDERYRELEYIPLANVLRWASLWECDYGVGEHVRTFWSVCPTPANHCIAECENHHNRRYLRDYYKLAGSEFTPEVKELISDSWKYGPLQSYYTLPPVLIQSGAKWSLVKEGGSETGGDVHGSWEVDYQTYVPLEDAHAGWCKEPNWYDKNPKNGTVGQEIYGAGGLIWYALWQNEELK